MKNDLSEYEKYIELLKYNPNIILTGVSGTGKTFTTKKIIECFEKSENLSPDYDLVEKQGRVKFITFHNSYSYESFVEGIKNSDNINDGILKKLAISASFEILKSTVPSKIKKYVSDKSKIWKVSLGYRKTEERIYSNCKKQKEISVGWLENESLEGRSYNEIYSMLESKRGNDEPKLSGDAISINSIVNEMKKGDFVLIYDSSSSITDIGIVNGDYFHDLPSPYPHKRKVIWFKEFAKPVDISEYDFITKNNLKTIYELEQINFSDLREIISEDKNHSIVNHKQVKPYYLIIDEINRGDVPKVFGEVISLIDKTKRDIQKCTLPYSQKKFSLPSNLFFIGTLNSRNTSVFDSDNVLRSRFIFIKLEPDITLIENITVYNLANKPTKINPSKLLNYLNCNISSRKGKNYNIGHAYFFNHNSIQEIFNLWYFRIIPLLQNYFSHDEEIIKTIIGNDFFDDYNNLKYLDTKCNSGKFVSEFEKALIKIQEKDI